MNGSSYSMHLLILLVAQMTPERKLGVHAWRLIRSIAAVRTLAAQTLCV
jgi:hypothetical protein